MTFNIGRQDADVINNVGRDQFVQGGQSSGLADAQTLAALLAGVRSAVADTALPFDVRTAITKSLDSLDRAVGPGGEEPKNWRARFEDVTALLSAAAGAAGNWGTIQDALLALGRGLGLVA
jgi:hypothetical protein